MKKISRRSFLAAAAVSAAALALTACGGSVALSLPSPSPAVTPLPKGEAFASGQTERFCIYTSLSSFILHNCLQFGFNLMEFLHNT